MWFRKPHTRDVISPLRIQDILNPPATPVDMPSQSQKKGGNGRGEMGENHAPRSESTSYESGSELVSESKPKPASVSVSVSVSVSASASETVRPAKRSYSAFGIPDTGYYGTSSQVKRQRHGCQRCQDKGAELNDMEDLQTRDEEWDHPAVMLFGGLDFVEEKVEALAPTARVGEEEIVDTRHRLYDVFGEYILEVLPQDFKREFKVAMGTIDEDEKEDG
ncbi:hypothetical protein SODALDRAFT_84023 [Sodiomyces alkalinus F11]|uniref:Uncharacterized protein n=1 Tax=Sodiomyces alkalinus (strain CBS 110278 / VKM F-3762 / F11) TaxID=1314773 RepID=A0A3N2PJM6_SODAK|nr:hypothetical protein SODALDRAFT_84023 [Sodiomyces alkalinus F11]ROT34727.1 hypothetical protein SODALDRAFT_84023 [Sodiomyces alkalinus F11]